MTNERNEILRVFLQEASEKLEALDGFLLEIEDNPAEREFLHQFMRAAHTIKGSAGVAGLESISNLAHSIESVVEKLRDEHILASPELFDRVAEAIDVMNRALKELANTEQVPTQVETAQEDLDKWLQTLVTHKPAGFAEKRVKEEFDLGEYDYVRIRVLSEKNQSLYRVVMPLPEQDTDRESFVPIVAKVFRKHGTLVQTSPALTDVEHVRGLNHIVYLLATDNPLKKIENALFSETKVRPIAFRPFIVRVVTEQDNVQLSGAILADRTVRVELSVLDELLRLVGELMISRDRYRQIGKQIGDVLNDRGLGSDIDDSAGQLGHLTGDLQDAIMEARMVPVSRVFRVLKRYVRHIARETGHAIHFQTQGDETELDKNLVDSLSEPLGRFVAAIAHYQIKVRSEDEDAKIHIKVSAQRRWNNVFLFFDSNVVREDAENLKQLKEEIAQAGGQIEKLSLSPNSTRYQVSLPLTLAIVRVMMTRVGDEVFAFPIETVKETLKLHENDIVSIKGTRVTELRGRALSLLILADLFDVPKSDNKVPTQRVLVLSDVDRPIGIVVDHLLGIREVVIKPLGTRFAHIQEISGSAILGDEQIALILNAEALVRTAIEQISQAGVTDLDLSLNQELRISA